MPVLPLQPNSAQSLEIQLIGYLLTLNTLTATLGADVTSSDPSLFRDLVPQDAPLPAIAMQRISTLRKPTLANGGELVTVRLQFSIVAPAAAQADAVAEQMRVALNLYQGTLPGGIAILFAQLVDEREMPYEYSSAA